MLTELQKNLADDLYGKLKSVRVGSPFCQFTRSRCESLAPEIEQILELKREKNALILAHSYIPADIVYSVADFVGDSYFLAQKARETDHPVILFAAVDFMAETAKILNPTKRVFKPNRNGGCSLAESITSKDVRELRRQHPDHTFVCYINTTADVKAACDVTVTSSNVEQVIESIPNQKIFFVPDRLMGANVARSLREKGSTKEILYSDGTCYVHEEYDGAAIPMLRRQFADLEVLSHPECRPSVTAQSDFVGSTNQLMDEVKRTHHDRYLLLTECGLIARLESEFPEKKFVGACTLCKYMKGNSLADIRRCLENPSPEDEILIPEEVRLKAFQSLERMFQLTK